MNIKIDTILVERLIRAQFPHWADLPIKPVKSSGWDNRTFHLGEHMTVRLPSAEAYTLQVEKEHRWLPKLAPLLPLAIPIPLAMGKLTNDYPWHWSVYQWLDGETASQERIVDRCQFAKDLAKFLVELQKIDASDGPSPGPHNFYRGGSLTTYEAETQEAISKLKDRIDVNAVREVWEAAIATRWSNPPVWVHGDISPGNLLVTGGRLSAVIDFGTSGVGDPACDLAIAWKFFEGKSREAFRAALPLDDATWARGRGWVLWKALIVLAGHPAPAHEIEESERVLNEVLTDYKKHRG